MSLFSFLLPKPPASAGAQAEALAARFLRRQGLHILARNYRCRGGELDLICEDDDTLIFVEVRLRRNPRYGGAGASIGAAKRRRAIRAARHWLAGKPARACRFDAILLDRLDEGGIEWIRGAFDAA